MSLKLREGRYYRAVNGVVHGPFYLTDAWRAPGSNMEWFDSGYCLTGLQNHQLVEEVVITPAPKPVSGTVAIIKTGAAVYRAETGRLLTNGQHLDENSVTDGRIVARLTWTEGDGMDG